MSVHGTCLFARTRVDIQPRARMQRSKGRTVLQGVVFREVVQVAGLHAREVVYLAPLSELSPLEHVCSPTRASRMVTMIDQRATLGESWRRGAETSRRQKPHP